MTTFFCLPALDFSGNSHAFTIATGPVIVNTRQTKILLHLGKSTQKWQYLGGRYSDDVTFLEAAEKMGNEEIGKNNKIIFLQKEPILFFDTIDLKGSEEKTLMIHYLARIEDEESIGDARWFSLSEIEILDAKNQTSSPNVRILAEKILK